MREGWKKNGVVAGTVFAIVFMALLPIPLAAADSSDTAETTVGVRNSDGTASGLAFFVDDEETGEVLPATGNNRAVVGKVTGRDGNGHNDLEGASLVCLTANCPIVIGDAEMDEAEDDEATWSFDLEVPYWTAPGTYVFEATVHEKGNKNHVIQSTLIVEEILGLGLGAKKVNFGQSLVPGGTSAIQSLTVLNTGNVGLDLLLDATALGFVGGGSKDVQIPAAAMEYGKSATLTDAAAFAAGEGQVDLNLAPGAGAAAPLYLRLTIPGIDEQYVPPGSYVGELTVTGAEA